MQCVYEDNRLPNGFEEQFEFTPHMPYTISIKHFPREDEVPLHYAETIEVLLCDHLAGHLVIDDQRFTLGGQQLFVIPPYTVHANSIRPGEGVMHVLKVSFAEIGHYLNLAHYLELCGCQAGQLAYCCPEYGGARHLIDRLIQMDGDLPACLPLILHLFSLLSQHTSPARSATGPSPRLKSASLQELISWTQTNYASRITIEQAARLTGYSKYHFCTRFKSLTGMTYLNYLSRVRISHACLMLRDGQPVSKVCRECGYETVSYFTQIFKRIMHMTPTQYIEKSKP